MTRIASIKAMLRTQKVTGTPQRAGKARAKITAQAKTARAANETRRSLACHSTNSYNSEDSWLDLLYNAWSVSLLNYNYIIQELFAVIFSTKGNKVDTSFERPKPFCGGKMKKRRGLGRTNVYSCKAVVFITFPS